MQSYPATYDTLKQVVEDAAKILGIPTPELKIKDVRRGVANYRGGWVSVPRWAVERGFAYAAYYVIHEVTHHHPDAFGHGPTFKHLEAHVLAEFGMTIKRRRVYAKRLHALSGPVLYSDADAK